MTTPNNSKKPKICSQENVEDWSIVEVSLVSFNSIPFEDAEFSHRYLDPQAFDDSGNYCKAYIDEAGSYNIDIKSKAVKANKRRET